MKWSRCAFLCVTFVSATEGLVACNAERKQECDKFLSAMAPLDEAAPTVDTVARAHDAVTGIQFQDEPLREYAKNATATLKVLSSTLELQADPAAPDGTPAVVKEKLRQARGERDDVARYCSP
jgi:hypothetical protein